MTPSCSPSALTTRTSRTLMASLMRMSLAWLREVAPRTPRRGRGADGEVRRGSLAAHGEVGRTLTDLADEIGHDLVERHRAEILAGAAAQAHRPLLGLATADHQHVGDLAHLRVADLVAELLVAIVQLDPDVGDAQTLVHRSRVVAELLRHRQ